MKKNNQFKRLMCLVMVLVMTFAFGGCETAGTVSAETDPTQTSETLAATQEATEASDATVSASQEATDTVVPEDTQPNDASAPAPSTPAPSANDSSGGNNTPTKAPTSNDKVMINTKLDLDNLVGNPGTPHSHSYSAAGTVSASCDKKGYTTYKCSCGSSYKDNYTAALGHSYSSKVVDPTTESKGYTQYTCSRCGNSYKDNYTDKLPQSSSKEYERLVVQYVLQYLNEHRAAVGAPALKSLSGMSKVADYRADQLTSNYGHHSDDVRAAHAYYQYGHYVDATWFGQDASDSYYTADAREAICSVWDYGDAQRLAKEIADGFRASAPHWSYLGSAENTFAGIGVAFYNNYCYGCIMVGAVNYG